LQTRVEQSENGQVDLRVAVSGLLATVEQHKAFHETSDRNMQAMQRTIDGMLAAFIQKFDQVQAEIRGLQTENRRILDVLQGLTDED
jgi:hypothetical protein